MTEFQDIKIVELSDAASGLANEGPLTSMVLRLSAEAPAAWSDMFNEAWQTKAGMMRRKAVSAGDTITCTCMPYELQGQISELNKVIAETNIGYREAATRAETSGSHEIDPREELRDLKNTLKYD
ncbi:hypothetical protein [Rhizobium terrae]|uniref:hypothetical protein n=1 Tax=Rhizobium terrae TaxID=2171756 RepID=UPI000E3D1419|nr:hypothetical protein [Rhizobium terrae]